MSQISDSEILEISKNSRLDSSILSQRTANSLIHTVTAACRSLPYCDEAAKGQGKYVTDLLRSGYDLDGIYGNYVSLMAQAFNIDRRTIKLDDPLLKSVFTDQGGMKFNDFQTLLRSDARFKGTPGMGEEKDIRQSIIDRWHEPR